MDKKPKRRIGQFRFLSGWWWIAHISGLVLLFLLFRILE